MVLRRRLTVLLATVMLLGVMSVPPALAVPGVNQGHQIDDSPFDRDQGGGNNHIKIDKGKGND